MTFMAMNMMSKVCLLVFNDNRRAASCGECHYSRYPNMMSSTAYQSTMAGGTSPRAVKVPGYITGYMRYIGARLLTMATGSSPCAVNISLDPIIAHT